MKELWKGQEVNFEGEHWQVHQGRLALTPIQKPHPAIWIAAQSKGAVRRAAALGDACLLGPQPTWEDIRLLAGYYREALAELGKEGKGFLGASRSMTIARDRETAIKEAQTAGEAKAGMYADFNMQETTTVGLGLSGSRQLSDWTIAGNPQDCVEVVTRCHEEQGMRAKLSSTAGRRETLSA